MDEAKKKYGSKLSYPCEELDFLLGDPGSQDRRLAAKLSHLRGKPAGLLGHQFSLCQSLVRRGINSPELIIWPDVLKGLWSQGGSFRWRYADAGHWLLTLQWKAQGNKEEARYLALTVPSENPLWQRNRREDLIFFTSASLLSSSISGCTLLSRNIMWGAYRKSYQRTIERRILNGGSHLQPRKSP